MDSSAIPVKDGEIPGSIQHRKQQHWQVRHELLLNVARRILREEGYRGLTMELIGRYSSYSKGTVYQHFTCKEAVILALAADSLKSFKVWCSDILSAELNSRQKFVTAFEAYHLYTQIYQVEFQHLSTLRSPSIWQKTPPLERQKFEGLQVDILAIFVELIEQSHDSGELTLPEHNSAQGIAISLWSMLHGALTFESYEKDWSYLGLEDLLHSLRSSTDVFLDGLNWQPLSTSQSAEQICVLARSTVLQPVIKQLTNIQPRDSHA